MNITRVGSAAAVGIADAAVDAATITPLNLAGQVVKWSTILEFVAVVGGAAMQMINPYTLPHVVDGVLDGGAALLARRGAHVALHQMSPATYPQYAHRIGGSYVAPQLATGAFGQIGAVSTVPRRQLV